MRGELPSLGDSLLLMGFCMVCGCQHAAQPTPDQLTTQTKISAVTQRAVSRNIVESGETLKVEQSFKLRNDRDVPIQFTLASKSCGCLGYLPEEVLVSARSTHDVTLKGTLTGSPSQAFNGYNASFRNETTGQVSEFYLDTWVAPRVEILPGAVCDGRVIWRTSSDQERETPCRFELMFRATERDHLKKCGVAVRREDRFIPVRFSVGRIELNEQSGFWGRRASVEIPSRELNLTDTLRVLLSISTTIGECSTVLAVKLRDEVRTVPASVFFRAGVAEQKIVTIRSDAPLSLGNCESSASGVRVSLTEVSEHLQKMEIRYDGSLPVAPTANIDILILEPRKGKVSIPVYYLGVASAEPE